MQIEMDERMVGVLERLRAQATAQLMPLDAYLERFVQTDEQATAVDAVSLAEFDRILDELAAGPIGAATLPAEFSRADIYADHD